MKGKSKIQEHYEDTEHRFFYNIRSDRGVDAEDETAPDVSLLSSAFHPKFSNEVIANIDTLTALSHPIWKTRSPCSVGLVTVDATPHILAAALNIVVHAVPVRDYAIRPPPAGTTTTAPRSIDAMVVSLTRRVWNPHAPLGMVSAAGLEHMWRTEQLKPPTDVAGVLKWLVSRLHKGGSPLARLFSGKLAIHPVGIGAKDPSARRARFTVLPLTVPEPEILRTTDDVKVTGADLSELVQRYNGRQAVPTVDGRGSQVCGVTDLPPIVIFSVPAKSTLLVPFTLHSATFTAPSVGEHMTYTIAGVALDGPGGSTVWVGRAGLVFSLGDKAVVAPDRLDCCKARVVVYQRQ